jgi:tetratricopeptide (TPR) repeat protein
MTRTSWLSPVILLSLLALGNAQGAEAPPRPSPLVASADKELSPSEREELEPVMRLWDQKDFAGAIVLLEPIARRPGAAPVSIALLAYFYERDHQEDKAIRTYRQCLSLLGPGEDLVHVSVRFALGRLLLNSGQYGEAVTLLEQAWNHPAYEVSDPMIPELLAQAYAGLQRPELAAAFAVGSIGIAPAHEHAWKTWDLLGGKPKHFRRPPGFRRDVFFLGESPTAELVLRHGNPREWQEPELERAVRDYLSFAEALEAQAPAVAARFRQVGLTSYFRGVIAAMNARNPQEGLRRLNEQSTSAGYESLPLDLRLFGLGLESRLHIQTAHLIHAVQAVERMSELARQAGSPRALALVREEGIRLSIAAFYSVSFDPITGQLREDDPEDFLGPGSGGGGETARERRFRYGMTSPDEDSATVRANDLAAEMGLDPGLEERLESLIRARNLELPVKVYLKSVSLELGASSGRVGGTSLASIQDDEGISLLERLEQQISAHATPAIPPTTVTAYVVGKRLMALFSPDAPR